MKNLWFGYQYSSGDYQVKRYFVPLDISEVQECLGQTVRWVHPQPFEADSREEALKALQIYKSLKKIQDNSFYGAFASNVKTYEGV